METFSSIHKLSLRHAMVTRDPLNMEKAIVVNEYKY
jgi:hypothetical protein